MVVLALAPTDDEHAVAVAHEVSRLGGDLEIVDLSAFPEQARLTISYDCCGGGRRFQYTSPTRALDLAEVGAIWWRRPQSPRVSSAITRASHRLFASNEAQEALAGLWHALDVFWVNDPGLDAAAHRKVYQLRVAQDVGLRIPATLITNEPHAARSFVDARGYRGVIYKAFSAMENEWRETRLLRLDELAMLDNVTYAPVIFQEYVEAVYDLRVTLVGDEVYAAAIHSQQTEYPVDFRMDLGSARIEPVSLPDQIVQALHALRRRLGLQYGAVDMRRSLDDQYVFLEINPAGQWLFVERASGQPIAAALARLLVSHDRRRRGHRRVTTRHGARFSR